MNSVLIICIEPGQNLQKQNKGCMPDGGKEVLKSEYSESKYEIDRENKIKKEENICLDENKGTWI